MRIRGLGIATILLVLNLPRFGSDIAFSSKFFYILKVLDPKFIK